jgi:hypothetical protein
VEQAGGAQASGGDSGVNPGLIRFSEQAFYLVPAGAFASLAGLADQHHEEIEPMTCGAYETVRAGPCRFAEGDQELEEDGRGRASVCGASARTSWPARP